MFLRNILKFFNIDTEEENEGKPTETTTNVGTHAAKQLSDTPSSEEADIATAEGFFSRLSDKGVDINTLNQLTEFLGRLNKMLPESETDVEFMDDRIRYSVVNASTGRKKQLFNIDITNNDICYSQGSDSGSTSLTFHIGTNQPENARNMIFFANIDDIDMESIQYIRERFINITGNKNLAEWKFLNERQKTQKRFWTLFIEKAKADTRFASSGLHLKNGNIATSTYFLTLGTTHFWISLLRRQKGGSAVLATLYISPDVFPQFSKNKNAVEAILGKDIIWQTTDRGQGRIQLLQSMDTEDESKWDECSDWLIEKSIKLKETVDKLWKA